MIEIFLLEQLAAFEQYGTLTRAAEELHITQPALTRSMHKLEDAFGVPLFQRSKSKIALNETGKVAARYARRVLEADQEMVERTVAFDRSRRTIVLGACAALPIHLLLPALQEQFSGMAITSEISSDEKLIAGLHNRTYQLAVLHESPTAEDLFCQRYLDERLCVALPRDHPLAARESVSFQELDGLSLLAHQSALFWMERCKQKLPHSRLLAQDSLESLHELVDSSTLPAFSSDRVAEWGYESEGRITIPIRDEDAFATYYLVCLQSDKAKYNGLFSAVRSAVIQGR